MRFKATVTWHIQLSFAEQFFCRLPMLDQLVACTSLGTDVCLDFGFFYCSVFGETNQPNKLSILQRVLQFAGYKD